MWYSAGAYCTEAPCGCGGGGASDAGRTVGHIGTEQNIEEAGTGYVKGNGERSVCRRRTVSVGSESVSGVSRVRVSQRCQWGQSQSGQSQSAVIQRAARQTWPHRHQPLLAPVVVVPV